MRLPFRHRDVLESNAGFLSNCCQLDYDIDAQPKTYSTSLRSRKQDSWLSPRTRNSTKRLIDLSLAVPAILATAPIWIIIAVLITFDGGPVFFKHSRVGRNGRIFKCLKFRTMAINADLRLSELLASNATAQQEWQESRKLRVDPRVTRIGRILRTTSLDELPQLLNVIRGEMSLVGPRPVTQDELIRYYGEALADYQAVRPGLTGAWQISGRSTIGYSERVRLDKTYVRTLSIRSDFCILAKTFRVVFRREGAC